MNGQKRCYNCMRILEEEKHQEICPWCGFEEKKYIAGGQCLPPGTTLLNGRYLIGRKLSQGGFGITYIGWDNALEHKVAVKEYYPSEFVERDTTKSYSVSVRKQSDLVSRERDNFVKEARILYSLSSCPGIVHIENIIENENDTSYLIMELLEGVTLKQYRDEHRNQQLDPKEALELMKPVIRSMQEVHKMGLLHRDISPDNIMLCNDLEVKLLDFGAARSQDSTQFTTIMKTEFSPPEQRYRKPGEGERSKALKQQGPWTDVYAVCATLYYLIAGKAAQSSQGRVCSLLETGEDSLTPLSVWNEDVTPELERAVSHGMVLKIQKRTASMEELYRDLYECPQNGTTEEAVEEKAHRWKWMAGIFLAGLCMVGIVLAGIYMRSSKTSVAGKLEEIRKEKPVETIKSKSKTYRMIRVEGMKRKEAAGALQQLADSSLEIIWKRKYSSTVKKGEILSQSIAPGTEWEAGSLGKLTIYVSRGRKYCRVPVVRGEAEQEARRLLKKAKLRICVMKEYHETVPEGLVVEQSVKAGRRVKKNTKITVIVSKGSNPAAGQSELNNSTKTIRGSRNGQNKVVPPM